MANAAVNLHDQQLVSCLQTIPDVVLNAVGIETLLAKVAGENHFLQNFDNLDDIAPGGKGCRLQVMQRYLAMAISGDDLVSDSRQLMFQPVPLHAALQSATRLDSLNSYENYQGCQTTPEVVSCTLKQKSTKCPFVLVH